MPTTCFNGTLALFIRYESTSSSKSNLPNEIQPTLRTDSLGFPNGAHGPLAQRRVASTCSCGAAVGRAGAKRQGRVWNDDVGSGVHHRHLVTWENRTPKDCYGIVLLVMQLVSPILLGLFQAIMANPCGLSRLQICPRPTLQFRKQSRHRRYLGI